MHLPVPPASAIIMAKDGVNMARAYPDSQGIAQDISSNIIDDHADLVAGYPRTSVSDVQSAY